AKALISENPQSCRLDQVVERSGVSHVHFARTFLRHVGVRPVEYRAAQRLIRAVTLLQDRSAAISAVAQECGFSDQSHLARVASRTLGRPPSELRENPFADVTE